MRDNNMTFEENKRLCLLISDISDPLSFGKISNITITIVDNDDSKDIMYCKQICIIPT